MEPDTSYINNDESSNSANMVSPSPGESKSRRKRRAPAVPWKKPHDMPRRPLSAYNLFFKQERERLIRAGIGTDGPLSGGKKATTEGKELKDEDFPLLKPTLPDPNAPKSNAARKHARSSGIGFANLAKLVAAKWKNLDPKLKEPFEEVANRDKERYKEQMIEWRAQQRQKKEEKAGVDDVEVAPVWNAHVEVYPTSYPHPVAGYEHTPPRQDWHRSQEISHEMKKGNLSSAHDPAKRQHGHKNGYHAPPYSMSKGSPVMDTKKDPVDKSVPEAEQSETSAHATIYRRVASFDSSEHVPADAYPAEYYYGHWDGYERYGPPVYGPGSPYAAPYAYHAADGKSFHHFGPEELHHHSVGYGHAPPYGRPYGPQIQEYPGYTRSRGYPPTYPPRYQPVQSSAASPYPYGYHPYPRQPHSTPRLYEETLQLSRSREDFKKPPNPTSTETKSDKPKSAKKAQAKGVASKSEECSILGQTFEPIDSNLDTDTVDFLTSFELE